MSHLQLALLLALALFAGMLLLLEIGHWIGVRHERIDPEGAHSGTGAIEGAVFALLGLLVAFTFSGAASRFDTRRQLMVDEANDVGTAYLRLDLLPPDTQSPTRALFRRYVDARLTAYAQRTLEAAREPLARAAEVQNEIWSQAVAGCGRAAPQPCSILLLPALNAMFDLGTTQTMTVQMHPPPIVFYMLCGVGLACSILAGYGMAFGARRKLTHTIIFAAVTALTFYVILDFEYPRRGLITIDAFDQALIDVRAQMDR